MQGTGHVKERLSLNGPGSARYPDSVVVGTLGPTATRVKESAEGRPGERLESFAEAGVRGTTPVEERPAPGCVDLCDNSLSFATGDATCGVRHRQLPG